MIELQGDDLMKSRTEMHRLTAEKKRRLAPRGNRGFVMMEAMIGALILGIIVAGMLHIFEFGNTKMWKLTQDRSLIAIGRNEMETIIAGGYENAVSGIDSSITIDGRQVMITKVVSFVDDPADSLGELDTDGIEDYKAIQVSVAIDGENVVSLQTVMIP